MKNTTIQKIMTINPNQKYRIKYYSRLNVFKASNLVFDPENMTGYSYEWYKLAKSFNGVLVVNNYNYSASTCKHIIKIKTLFDQLGLTYETIEAPKGLQNLEVSEDHYKNKIESLTKLVNTKGTRKAKNVERLAEIEKLKNKLTFIQSLKQSEAA